MEFSKLGKIAVVAAFALAVTGCSGGGSVQTKPDYSQVPQVIAVVGDFGVGNQNELDVSKLVSNFDPSFVVTAGDNVYNNLGYETLVKQYYPQQLVPVTGNHDYINGIANFDNFFNISPDNRTYVYRAASGVDFFVLDSQSGLDSADILDSQQSWLIKAAQESTATFKVVVLHHPPFSSGKHGSTKQYQWDFTSMGIDLVISGHDHTYERIIHNGTTYVVDGTGGAGLYKCKPKRVAGSLICVDNKYGALFLYVNKYQMRAVFRTATSETLDTFTFNR